MSGAAADRGGLAEEPETPPENAPERVDYYSTDIPPNTPARNF